MITTPPAKYDCKVRDNLPRLQKKVFELLSMGGKYSAADISTYLHICDPRGHIAYLRRKGILVRDEWRDGNFGVRYKVYFL